MHKLLLAWLIKTLQPQLRDRVFKIRTGPARGLYRRYGFGFKPRIAPTVEESFLASLDLEGQTIYDVGSYVGIFTLFFARAVGRNGNVIAFEPDPANFAELEKNIQINAFKNVQIFCMGVGHRATKQRIVKDPIFPSRSKLEEMEGKEVSDSPAHAVVRVDTLDNLQRDFALPDPDLVKIDVEGQEKAVLCGMQDLIHRCKPRLHIEIHESGTELFQVLEGFGYSILHVEQGDRIEHLHLDEIVPTFHVYCE